MSFLAKLNLKTVQRVVQRDPVIARRDKLLAGIAEQRLVLDATARGESYITKIKRWREDGNGDKALVEVPKRVRPWFFQQDNGWYVQCRYGARILAISGRNNAVFVNKLDEVAAVLEAFRAATDGGELDRAVLLAMKAKTGAG
ncbi:hypothetical protein AQZ52_02000 [Novosphingobium fuchskuhlense]|uniref:Uncharacterized protein n=1 Tax=Novosphingobium fuchskuhlense TaxID=1117702 RepID=A0A117UWG5_9SPHN|nr:DUF6641 family protein [Novosphingobium fuchskuhlense]KUR72103.1 hypothetical protein AQZ52_02000 [Novosphingobium fuchskuhlense]